MGNSCCIIIIVYNLSVMVPLTVMARFLSADRVWMCMCVYLCECVCVLRVHTCRFILNRDTHYYKSLSKASVNKNKLFPSLFICVQVTKGQEGRREHCVVKILKYFSDGMGQGKHHVQYQKQWFPVCLQNLTLNGSQSSTLLLWYLRSECQFNVKGYSVSKVKTADSSQSKLR